MKKNTQLDYFFLHLSPGASSSKEAVQRVLKLFVRDNHQFFHDKPVINTETIYTTNECMKLRYHADKHYLMGDTPEERSTKIREDVSALLNPIHHEPTKIEFDSLGIAANDRANNNGKFGNVEVKFRLRIVCDMYINFHLCMLQTVDDTCVPPCVTPCVTSREDIAGVLSEFRNIASRILKGKNSFEAHTGVVSIPLVDPPISDPFVVTDDDGYIPVGKGGKCEFRNRGRGRGK